MANTSKVVAIFVILVLLQVSCAAGRHVQVKDSSHRVHDAPAVMSLTSFEKGDGDTGPAECDGKYHSDDLFLVSLTSGAWYGGGIRCGKMIRIATPGQHGLAVEAMVVDECDIEQGCGVREINTSAAVWKALGIDVSVGEVTVTWSDLS